MKAAVITKFGGPEVLAIEDAPTPNPGPGEVLVRVHAAGLNRAAEAGPDDTIRFHEQPSIDSDPSRSPWPHVRSRRDGTIGFIATLDIKRWRLVDPGADVGAAADAGWASTGHRTGEPGPRRRPRRPVQSHREGHRLPRL